MDVETLGLPAEVTAKLTVQQLRAAEMIAEGRLNYDEIGQLLNLPRQSITRWKTREDFRALLAALIEQQTQEIISTGVANKRNRVRSLDERAKKLSKIAEERGQNMSEVPGGSTGFLTRRIKSIGSGPSSQVVEEYEFDAPLLREMRAHEEQAARELGQWTEKSDVTEQPLAIVQVVVAGREEASKVLARIEQSSSPQLSTTIISRSLSEELKEVDVNPAPPSE